MHSMLHFTGYNLKRLFTCPRPYITFLLLFAVMQIGLGGCRNYLIENNQVLQAAELYVFAHSSNAFLLYFTLGLLLLLGDAPFLKEGMSLRLIRSSRTQWLLGQILSCMLISVIYLVVLELLFLLLFCGHISFQNTWSAPIILAAQLGNGIAIGTEMAVPFPMQILRAGSPYVMFGLTFFYNFLLYTFFSVILIVCNLKLRTGIGAFAVLTFVGLKFMLDYVFYVDALHNFSPCNLVCLSDRPITSMRIVYTVLFFFVLSFCLGLLAHRFTRSADLLREDYA